MATKDKSYTWKTAFNPTRAIEEEIKIEKKKSGRCRICDSSAFSLKIIERDLIRICKNCNHKLNTDKEL